MNALRLSPGVFFCVRFYGAKTFCEVDEEREKEIVRRHSAKSNCQDTFHENCLLAYADDDNDDLTTYIYAIEYVFFPSGMNF